MQKIDYDQYVGDGGTPERRKKDNPFKKYGLKILAIGFLVFVTFRMVTMETDLNLFTTFKIPEGVSLEEIKEMNLAGQWSVAIDGKNVISSSEMEKQATASTTKMILALAIMEKKPFELPDVGETITITQEMYDKYAWYLNNNGSNTKVTLDEEISEYDALISTLLASSNNMADSLAIWAFGSIEEYQKYAMEMLARLGITDTVIGDKDASGYDDGTTSTAADLARVGYFVMKNPVLADIVGKKMANVPVVGTISNTNKLLGVSEISGIKTGYIGDASGYCIISAYKEDGHVYTVALLGADTRDESFDDNLAIVEKLQDKLVKKEIVKEGEEVGYFESWWSGKIPITADEELSEVNYSEAETKAEIMVNALEITIDNNKYKVPLDVPEFKRSPNLVDRFLHVFGWEKS